MESFTIMQNTAKKAYAKPQIEEVARLDRFINAGSNFKYNDSEKYKLMNGMYIYFETSKPMV